MRKLDKSFFSSLLFLGYILGVYLLKTHIFY
jgi:hypothetical protein